MDTITVTVTETHRNCGSRNSAFTCPIALAGNELGLGNFSVSSANALLTNNFHMEVYKVPPEAKQFMRAFDRGEYVSVPQTFVFTKA